MIDINQQPSPQFLQRPAPQALPGEMRFGPGGPVANQAQPPMQSVGKPPPLDVPQIMPQPTSTNTSSFIPTPPKPSMPSPAPGPAPVSEGRARLAQALIGKQQEVNHPMQALGNAAGQMAQAYADKRQAAPAPIKKFSGFKPRMPMMANRSNPNFPRGR